jgi:hypothetical protein
VSDEDTTSTEEGGGDDGGEPDDRDELEALEDRIADVRRRADDVSRESAADPSLHVPRHDSAGEGGTAEEGGPGPSAGEEGTDAEPDDTDAVADDRDSGGQGRG